jgi:hypothetical protein
LVVAQQPTRPPVSTIPPRPGGGQQIFSTIPPLPPTATPVLPTTTRVTVPTPLPTRVVPAAPTLVPARPAPVLPAGSSAAPRAGGFPSAIAWLIFTGSATVLGGGLYLLARLRSR